MFIPKKTKYKKFRKGKNYSKIFSSVNNHISTYNSINLISKSFGTVSSTQIKSFKAAIIKILKKNGRLILNLFAHIPVTKKPLEVRMGKGKGNVNSWVTKIKPGFIICKIETKNKTVAKKALLYSKIRLPITTKIL